MKGALFAAAMVCASLLGEASASPHRNHGDFATGGGFNIYHTEKWVFRYKQEWTERVERFVAPLQLVVRTCNDDRKCAPFIPVFIPSNIFRAFDELASALVV